MKKAKRVVMAVMCVISLMALTAGSAFAAEKHPADGVDLAPVNQLQRSTSRKYNTSEFSIGVYLNGAPFTMDSKGTAKFTSANQSAINSSEKADVSYQVLDNYEETVISGTRKIGNLTGQTIDVTSRYQAGLEVKIYLNNNAGVKTSASGTFNW